MEYENAQLEVGVPLVVWGASLTLSRWLEDHWEQLGIDKTSKTLELGSGTGLLGLYTIKRLLKDSPTASITMTDMEESSLELINENIKLNQINTENAKACYLKWGSFDSLDGPSSYDLIVGSDIIYSNTILDSLAQTIAYYLKAGSSGTAYIANNKVRYDNYGQQFEAMLTKYALKIIERRDIKDDGGFGVMRLLVIKKD